MMKKNSPIVDTSNQQTRILFFLELFIFAFCLIPLVSIWYFDYLPLQDYPNHFARLSILSDYDHSLFYREHFRVETFKGISPLPHLALDLFVNKAMKFLDTDTAMRVFISIYIISYMVVLSLLSRQLELEGATLYLINIPLMYSGFFHLGLLNFIFSIPLFLSALWMLNTYRANRNKMYILFIGILSGLMYLSHLFTLFIFCIFLFILFATKRLSFKDFMYIIILISPLLLFVMNYILISSLRYDTVRISLMEKAAFFLYFPFLHLPSKLKMVSAVCFVYAIYLLLRNSHIKNTHYFISFLIFIIIYFVLPFSGMNSNFIDSRALLFAFLLLPLSLKIKDMRYIHLSTLFLFVPSCVIVLYLFIASYDLNNNFSIRCAEKIEQKSTILPIDATPVIIEFRPYLHSWGYFYKFGEMLTPYIFSGTQQQIEYRKNLPAPYQIWVHESNIKSGQIMIDQIESSYDYILLAGSDARIENLIGAFSSKVCSDKLIALYEIVK